MGSSLYELDLELFEDIDSEVGNYFSVGTPTDILIFTVLALRREFFSGFSDFLPSTKTNTSKYSSSKWKLRAKTSVGCCSANSDPFFF